MSEKLVVSLRTTPSIRALLANLPPGVADKVFFDDNLPGYGLRVRKSGVHSLMIQYAIAGRTRRVVLGPLSRLDPGKAYASARELLAQVRLGRDPATEKDLAKARAAETFGALLPRFLERQRARLKPRSYEGTEYHLLKQTKVLHGLPVENIVRRTIASLLGKIEKNNGPAACNRARASLSAYFTWLAREGYIETNPVAFTNQAVENGERERVLSDDELRTIWLALPDVLPEHANGTVDYPAILKLLLLTGARRDEIADLCWSEIIDFHGTIIALPAERTKNSREHLIPLSEPALAILRMLPRRTNADGTPRDHVFGKGPRGFQGWSIAKRELDARIAEASYGVVSNWTPHDFRRSLSTSLHERFDVPPHVVEVILGHVGGHKSGVAGTYNKAIYLDERRRALERWGAHIMDLVTGKPAKAKIVKLNRAAATASRPRW